ncbi:hypothetical protein Taro_048966, partial [Colocasia esculenta]|nr:hypothetical protein [Colocasia esculenta]
DIPCKTCAKNKLERSRKSQKTRYLSTTIKDLSTDTTSQKATSSAKALPVDSRSAPVDRCNQSEDQKLWKACACRQQHTTCRQMHTVRAFSLLVLHKLSTPVDSSTHARDCSALGDRRLFPIIKGHLKQGSSETHMATLVGSSSKHCCYLGHT